jgi:hypothetical protein
MPVPTSGKSSMGFRSSAKRRLRTPSGAALLAAAASVGVSTLLFGAVQPLFVGDATISHGLRTGPNVARRVVLNAPAAPSRYAGRGDGEDEDESAYFDDEEDDEEKDGESEDEYFDMDEEEPELMPVLYEFPVMSRRLQRQGLFPGHLVQRKWAKKGKEQGFVSVPFLLAARNVMPSRDVNVCLVSRREKSDMVVSEWGNELDELPLFDISGEVDASVDLDPLEPAWDTPLDELPSDEEMREIIRSSEGMKEAMQKRFNRPMEQIESRLSDGRQAAEAKLLRDIVAGLPEELRDDEHRKLVRATSMEVMKLLWGVHTSSGATQLRWRLACTDSEGDGREAMGAGEGQFGQPGEALRAYFMLAGEGIDFVPDQFVDRKKVEAVMRLSVDAMRRMSSQDWAKSVVSEGTDVSQALKQVPAGWTTFLKGESWPGGAKGAVYHLPFTGRRLFIQVDWVQTDEEKKSKGANPFEADEDEEEGSTLSWLGPLAGVAAGLTALSSKNPKGPAFTPTKQANRAAQEYFSADAMKTFEDKMMTSSFGTPADAPVVLMLGSQTDTGKVISKKLLSSGYHVVLLNEISQPGDRKEKVLPQGAMLAAANVMKQTERVSNRNLPDDMYNAVAGIDKLVICQSDNDPVHSLSAGTIKDVLSAWQLYRQEFAERQRQYTAKVRIFNFARDTDFELWDLERQKPTDMCYGMQKAGWTRNSQGTALFVGQFFEPVGQAQLRSPRLKLNFKRFSGVLMRVYNQAVNNKYSFFLRCSDFEETRLQWEYTFECKASSWHVVRMPFNAFKPVRADGVELPEDEADNYPLRREDVVQMGISVRTGENPQIYDGDRLNYFSLAMEWVKVFRTQQEPQIVYVGRAEDIEEASLGVGEAEDDEEEEQEEMVFNADSNLEAEMARMREVRKEAEAAAEKEIEELEEMALKGEEEGIMQFEETKKKSPMQAVMESGLAFAAIKINGLNDHEGGKYPISVQQASVKAPHLIGGHGNVGRIGREDVAELVAAALTAPSCVNTEIAAGELLKENDPQADRLLAPVFEMPSATKESVKEYLKRLTPNQ